MIPRKEWGTSISWSWSFVTLRSYQSAFGLPGHQRLVEVGHGDCIRGDRLEASYVVDASVNLSGIGEVSSPECRHRPEALGNPSKGLGEEGLVGGSESTREVEVE